MNKENFVQMMGVLGRSYMSEWIFAAMDSDNNGSIDIGEFLDYYDIMINGSKEEKRLQNFKMMDIWGKGSIDFTMF